MDEEMITCDECRFFRPLEKDSEEGYCRRFAPRPRTAPRDAMTESSDDVVSWWPVVLYDDWCGEARRKSSAT